MSEQFISVDEAAAENDVSRATMWKWIKREEVPTFRVLGNRRTLIKREDLARLLEPIPAGESKKDAA